MSWKKSSLSGALKLNNHYATSKKGPLWISAIGIPSVYRLVLDDLHSVGLEPRETSLRRAQAVALITKTLFTSSFKHVTAVYYFNLPV